MKKIFVHRVDRRAERAAEKNQREARRVAAALEVEIRRMHGVFPPRAKLIPCMQVKIVPIIDSRTMLLIWFMSERGVAYPLQVERVRKPKFPPTELELSPDFERRMLGS
jgi:hypothetical protein